MSEASQVVNEAEAAPLTEDQRREAWLQQRRSHITGTDAAKILGMSKWGGPTTVWLDKRGELERGPEQERWKWGRILEEAILTDFAHKLGVPLQLHDPYALVVHPEHPLFAVSLDATITGEDQYHPDYGAPVDSKNVFRFDSAIWGEDGTSQVPDDYGIQMQMQMSVLGRDRAYLAALFSGQDPHTYAFERDPEIEAMVIEAGTDFWNRYVIAGVAPPPDGSDSYTEHLTRKLKQSGERLLDADPTSVLWAEALREARAKIKEIEKVQAEAEQNLKEIIGTEAGMVGAGFRITWKQNRPGSKTDYAAAIAALKADIALAATTAGGPDALAFSADDVIARLDAAVRGATKPTAGARPFVPKFDE